jgi:PD-(D/E)XK endonuclease
MSTRKRGKHSKNDWDRFSNFKQRGEWVELQFMARAALRHFAISKPWGDTQAYDVGIEYGPNFLRVQVKSTTVRSGAGYRCQFMPNHNKKRDYSLEEIDLFAAYVIPEDVWYLIPAVLLLGRRRHHMAMLCPVVPPKKKACYRYECYREAWNLLTWSRAELAQCTAPPPPRSHHRKTVEERPFEGRENKSNN